MTYIVLGEVLNSTHSLTCLIITSKYVGFKWALTFLQDNNKLVHCLYCILVNGNVVCGTSEDVTSTKYLKPMRDFGQFGDCWLLVDKLLLVKITKLGTIQTNAKVCAKHALPFLNTTTL